MVNKEKLSMLIHICIMFIGFGFASFLLFFSLIGLANQWVVGIIELSAGCYGLYYVIKNMPRDNILLELKD